MSKRNMNEDEELNRLMSFLAESVAQLTDEQLKDEFKGEPPPTTKAVLRTALKDLDQQRLRAARAEYESASKQLEMRLYKIPKGKSEQRALFVSIMSRQPDLRSLAVTAQHRELKELTDSDIESFLKQLAELGLLDSLLE